jgi:hypothetical protein
MVLPKVCNGICHLQGGNVTYRQKIAIGKLYAYLDILEQLGLEAAREYDK